MEGIRGSADDVVVTTGSQQALDLVTQALRRPGRRRARRGAELRRRPRRLQVATRPTSRTSRWTTTASSRRRCARRIARLAAEGRTIKFLYTIPNFHNPAGVTLTWDRRLEILEICRVERASSCSRTTPTACSTSTSRPPRRCARSTTRASSTSARSPRRSLPASAWAGPSPPTPSARSSSSPTSRRRCHPTRSGSSSSPSTSTRPTGEGRSTPSAGSTANVATPCSRRSASTCPPALDRTRRRLLRLGHPARRARLEGDAARAVKELVAYTPGTAFFADGGGRQNIRLSFCYPTPEFIRRGIRRLSTSSTASSTCSTPSSARPEHPPSSASVTMPPPNMS